jgi:hypothetical protein
MITGQCHCGAVHWTFDADPVTATACNCTVCRRYATLWAYDWLNERITTSGATEVYTRDDAHLGFHRCKTCGCVTWWQATEPNDEGRTRIAVNLRLANDPASVADLPIRHFDGLDTFTELPADKRKVRDMWF